MRDGNWIEFNLKSISDKQFLFSNIYAPIPVRILRNIQVDNINLIFYKTLDLKIKINILQNNVILRYDTNRNSEISGLNVIYWNFLWNKCLNYKFIHILRLSMLSLQDCGLIDRRLQHNDQYRNVSFHNFSSYRQFSVDVQHVHSVESRKLH